MINLIIGIIIMILIALIMIGGIKRIGRVTEKLIPFMAVLYIILASELYLLILIMFLLYLNQYFKVHFSCISYWWCSWKLLYEYEKRSIKGHLF